MSVLCGFITVLSGTMLLHGTREPEPASVTGVYNQKIDVEPTHLIRKMHIIIYSSSETRYLICLFVIVLFSTICRIISIFIRLHSQVHKQGSYCAYS